MKLVIKKSYPTYEVATEMANGTVRQRYTFNVSTFTMTPIDPNCMNMTKCRATEFVDETTERYWDILTAYRTIMENLYNPNGLTPQSRQKLDLWVNAYPNEMTTWIGAWGREYASNFNRVFDIIPNPNAELVEAINHFCDYTSPYRMENAIKQYLFKKQNKNAFYAEWLLDNANSNLKRCFYDMAIHFSDFKLPTALVRLTMNNFYRWGLGEQTNGHNGLAWNTICNALDLMSRTISAADRHGADMDEIFHYLDTEINQKVELVQEIEKTVLNLRIMQDKSKNEFLAQNVDKYLADKLNSTAFVIEPLRSVDDYTNAGKKWHNCLGSWGLSNSTKRENNRVHVVVEVTPKDGDTFVAGLYYNILSNKYVGCSYMVYDCNHAIDVCLQRDFEAFLMNTRE